MRDDSMHDEEKHERLQELYLELVKIAPVPLVIPPYRENLEQPSPLRIVDSVTTSGAYEDPI